MARGAQAQDLTIEATRALAEQFHQIVNRPGSTDVGTVLASAATPDVRTYTANESFRTSNEATAGITGLGSTLPDLT